MAMQNIADWRDLSLPSVSKSKLVKQQKYLESVLGVPFTQGNKVTVLRNGCEIFPAMLEAIESAEKIILFETYVYWQGDIAHQFAAALAKKAREGLTVRVLLDAYGSMKMDDELVDLMKDAGVIVRLFRPLDKRVWDMDKRTHRKLLVCDYEVGFTGGVGIAEEWMTESDGSGGWRETHFEMRGPVIHGLSGAFWSNWIEVSGETLPNQQVPFLQTLPGDSLAQVIQSSPSTHQSQMELVFEALITLAEERLTITTPYFNIRERTIEMLVEKAKQGVRIEILLPGGKIDQSIELLMADECLPELIEAGIVVHRYQPEMIHAKIIRVDEAISCVGSPNFNQRSRKKDFEIATLLIDQQVAHELDQQFYEDVAQSEGVKAEEVNHPSTFELLQRKLLLLFREQL